MAWHYLCSGNFGIGFLVCLAVDSTCAKGWHAKGYQPVGKSPGPMEQLTILLPIGSMYGIYANIWGILMVNVTIYGIHGSYGLGFHLESIKVIPLYQMNTPDSPKKWKTGKGRHAWSPQRVHFSDIFPKTWHRTSKPKDVPKSKHCACAVKWASLRRLSFRSGQTLSPARKSTINLL